MVNKLAFVGQKNFDIIEMHGVTTKITDIICHKIWRYTINISFRLACQIIDAVSLCDYIENGIKPLTEGIA
jgi:hypothetical protein